MKQIYFIGILLMFTSLNLSAEVECKKLPGFKKIGKDSIEYTKCVAKKGKKSLKLNTDSKLTDWIKKKLNK
ncbi:hypothetical protein IDH09_00245 [Pelagibacterales bacterium SAG-MED28]|nr:hypothetical protein [Pelagibacterales bacterium SAG-MED28]|tara:strand:+ start:759 stop:971 length:213 start_codon:yes stop_codon:yes gene_type:complete